MPKSKTENDIYTGSFWAWIFRSPLAFIGLSSDNFCATPYLVSAFFPISKFQFNFTSPWLNCRSCFYIQTTNIEVVFRVNENSDIPCSEFLRLIAQVYQRSLGRLMGGWSERRQRDWASGEKEQSLSASQSVRTIDWDLAKCQSTIDRPGCGVNYHSNFMADY